MPFESEAEFYAWAWADLHIEIQHKRSVVSQIRTAGNEKCNLCIQEKIHLFYDKGHAKRSTDLISNTSELFGKFLCTTPILRLFTVGDEGADEVTVQLKNRQQGTIGQFGGSIRKIILQHICWQVPWLM